MMTFLVCAVLTLGAVSAGRLRWRAGRGVLRDGLAAARLEPQGAAYDGSGLEALPPPVQRYLQAALKQGVPWWPRPPSARPEPST